MASDEKKCQSLINICAAQVSALAAITARLMALRDAYVAQAVDPTGTALEGNVSAVNSWISDIDAVATNAVASGLVAYAVPSHRNAALGV